MVQFPQPAFTPAGGGGFPSPTGVSFPVPTSNPLTFINPFSGASSLPVGLAGQFGLGPQNFSFQGFDQTALGRDVAASQMRAIARAGLDPGSDPRQWTPQEASTQTDVGLAKIAAVNPKMAKELQAQREGLAHDDGGGFFHQLAQLAGDIIHPALSAGGKLLEVLSRPAHIIPALLTKDPNEKAGFFDDVTGALTGSRNDSWSGVLEQWGVKNNLLRAVGGFVGDVLTDPVTYLFPAGAGAEIGSVAARTGEKVAVEAVAKRAVEAGRFSSQTEAAATFSDAYQTHLRDLLRDPSIAGRPVNDEAVGAALFEANRMTNAEDAANMWDISNTVYNRVRTGTLGTLLKGGTMTTGSGLELGGDEIKAILQRAVSGGNVLNRDAWLAARQYAQALPGWNLKFSLPLTRLKYTSGTLPFTEKLNFNLFRTMFAGQYTAKRIVSAIAAGRPGADESVLMAYMQGGWKSVVDQAPDLAATLRGRGLNGGGWFGPLSESLGGITAHLSPHAAASRAGLLGQYSWQARRYADAISNQLVHEYGRTWVKPDGTRVRTNELLGYWNEHLGLHPTRPTTSLDDQEKMAQYLEAFPAQEARAGDWKTSEDMLAWFDNTAKGLDTGTPEKDAVVQAERTRLAGLFDSMNPDQRQALWSFQDIWGRTRDFASKWGSITGDLSLRLSDMPALHPSDVPEWQLRTHPAFQWARSKDGEVTGRDFWFQPGSPDGANLASHGIDPAHALPGDHVTGYHFSSGPSGEPVVSVPGAAPMRAALRGTEGKLLVVNPEDATGSDFAVLDKAVQDAHNAVDGFADQVPGAEPDFRPQDLATADLQKQGYTGVVYQREGGAMDVVLFDHRDAKLVDESVGTARYHEGYAPRRFSGRLQEALKGRGDGSDPTVIYGLRPPGYTLMRKYAHLNRADAAEAIRGDLKDLGVNYDGPVFENDLLKLSNRYVADASKDVLNENLGRIGKRVEYLGNLSNTYLGRAAEMPTYRWVYDPSASRAAKQAGSWFEEKLLEQNLRMTRVMEQRQHAASVAAETHASTRAMLDAAVPGTDQVADRLVHVAGRRYVSGMLRTGEQAAKEVRGLETSISRIKEELARYDAAEKRWLASGATQESFDQHVLAGKLFAAKDGTITTARGSLRTRGLPLRPRQVLEDTHAALRSDAAALRQAIKDADTLPPNAGQVLYRGTRAGGERLRAADGGPWDQALFASTSRTSAATYGPNVERIVLRKSAKVLREDSEAFARLSPVGRLPDADYHGDALNELVRRARAEGYDAIQMNDQDALGTAIINPDAILPTSDTALHERIAKLTEDHATFAERVQSGVEKLSAQERAVHRKLGKFLRDAQDAVTETNRAFYRVRSANAAVKPALVAQAEERAGFSKLTVPGLSEHYMPTPIAAEFNESWNAALRGAPKDINVLQRNWRAYVQGPWKRWATYRFPGFHVRNFFGAWFNNWLGGTDVGDLAAGLRFAFAYDGKGLAEQAVHYRDWERYHLDRVFPGGRGKVTYNDVANMLSDHGIARSNTQSVGAVEALSEETMRQARRGGAKGLPMRWARRYDRTMQDFGSGVETYHRVAGWLTGMRKYEGDRYAARLHVMVRQGDYEDLNSFEYGLIRDTIPFYKWTRTNTPYQLHMLAENPALLVGVQKAKHAIFEAQGINQQEAEHRMPSWMKTTFAVPIPFLSKGVDNLKLATFDLPMADLYQGLNDYLSMALPQVRPLVESYALGKTVFSQKELTGEAHLLPGWLNVPGLRDVLAGLHLAQPNTKGQLTISDKTENVLMGFPLFSRFRNWVMDDPDRVHARANTLMSAFLGVGQRAVGKQEATDSEIAFYNNQVKPTMDYWRSLGITFPEKTTIAASVYDYLGLNTPPVKTKAPAAPTFDQNGVWQPVMQ